jgi:hypothetical protein
MRWVYQAEICSDSRVTGIDGCEYSGIATKEVCYTLKRRNVNANRIEVGTRLLHLS